MMATEIVQVDLDQLPGSVQVRDDVGGVLLVVMRGGRAVDLVRIARPENGRLDVGQVIGTRPLSSRDAAPAPSIAAGATPVSIVVCTRERPEDLERCLQSLAAATRDGDEAIVVDNAPVTGRTAELAARFAVRYVVEPGRGLDRARNAGLRAAGHEIVAFTDDDVVVSPSWRDALAACFADENVMCATGLVLPLELETRAQEEFEVYSAHRRTFEARVFVPTAMRASAADLVGIGANMAFRRPFALAIGGFDVRLDAGTCTRAGGDTDMFARVIEAGGSVAYSPDAQVWHRHRRTMAALRSCVFGYGAGTFSMLTKRFVERRDAGAAVTAARWVAGTVLKALREKAARRPSPSWSVLIAEWAGAVSGPLYFGYETWQTKAVRETTSGSK